MDILDAGARDDLCRALIERSTEGVYCFELEEAVSTRLSPDEQIEAFYRHGYLAQCNQTMAQMYGLSSPKDLLGARLGDLLPPSDPHNREYLQGFVRAGYFVHDAESHELAADGQARYFLNNLIGIVEGGHLVRAWGTQRNITEQRRAEVALQEAHEANARGLAQWRAVVDTMSDGLIVADAQGNMIEWNPAALRMHGYESVEEVRRHIATFTNLFELFTLDGQPVPMEQWPIARALRGETFANESFRLRRTDSGAERVLSYSGSPVGKDGGGLAHVTMRDETERRAAEEAVVRLNAELERRVEERTAELLAAYQEMEALNYSVSHDLRTPLRSVVSTSRILLDDHTEKLDPEAREQLERQVRAARKMGDLIDGLLTYSRLGREEPQCVELDLASLAREVNAGLAREEGPSVRLQAPEALPAYGDSRLLRMLLAELLGNARKFVKPHEDARVEIGKQDGAFFVRDEGIGFELQYAERIFRVFERLHLDDAFPGVGIGLANAKRIVERHGGWIWAEGQPGDGTTVWFTLPGR